MAGHLAAFMSYARFDDQHDDGQLTEFRERLAAEIRVRPGRDSKSSKTGTSLGGRTGSTASSKPWIP